MSDIGIKNMTIALSVDLQGVTQKQVFDQFILDLSDSLKRNGIQFVTGPNGSFIEGSTTIGRVTKWEPPSRMEVEWKTAVSWDPNDASRFTVSVESVNPIQGISGAKITVQNEGWGRLLGDNGGLLLSEWFEDEIIAHFIKAISPMEFTNWTTDRRARKPSGALARSTYRDPLFHRPGFKAVLSYLNLTKNDHLVEVGCGGGAFLSDALETGCRAVGIDHSADMVKVARELNSNSVSDEHLELMQGEAESLPYPDNVFSCAASTNVFGFSNNPVKFLSEIYRVLKSGGRLVLAISSKESKGTIASPYPIASLIHFYEEQELVELAKKAGFEHVKVQSPDMARFAQLAALPKDIVEAFSGKGMLFLIAIKG